MLFHKDMLSGIALLILCLLGTMSVCQLPAAGSGEAVGPATLPKFCLMVLALFAGLLIIRGIRLNAVKETAGFNFCLKSTLFYGCYLLYLYAMIAIGGFIVSINWIETIPYAGGFTVSTVLFLIFSFRYLRRKKIAEIVSVAVITTAVLAISFGGFFNVLLP